MDVRILHPMVICFFAILLQSMINQVLKFGPFFGFAQMDGSGFHCRF